MEQYQAKIKYVTGAVFVFGLTAPDLGKAIERADKIAPTGAHISYVLPVLPRNARRKPIDNP